MRWKEAEPTNIPDSTTAMFTFFAWLPLTLNGETRWLERVTVESVYFRWYDGLPRRWYPWRFSDQERPDPSNGFLTNGTVARVMPARPKASPPPPPKK